MKLLLNDTSVLLNLLAAECLVEISDDLDWQFAICAAVRDETKKLRDPVTGDMVPVEIAPLVVSGALTVLDLEGAEQDIYVEQASEVDDGEAMSIAIAATRGLELAMDDKQATSHVRRSFPSLRIWTTPEILHHWSTSNQVSAERLRSVVHAIEGKARYFPAKSHPLAAWWRSAR